MSAACLLDCSVIVLARDRADLTRRCFEALSVALDGMSCEVLLVDNASSDETPTQAASWASRFRRFTYLRQEQNLSFAVGNNLAAGAARGRALVFVNNDVFVRPDSVRRLVDQVLGSERTGVAGARLLFPPGARIQHAGIAQMLWGYPSNYGVGAEAGDPRFGASREMFAVTGALQCVRRETFEQVGGFDETFVWGYEDVDLCLAARVAGFDVLYAADVVAVHCESSTLKPVRRREVEDRNHARFRRKWDDVLVPREAAYVRALSARGIERVLVFGAGRAAEGVEPPLAAGGIGIVGYTTSTATARTTDANGRVIHPLSETPGLGFDAVLVASQFFFEVEPLLRSSLPGVAILHPVVD